MVYRSCWESASPLDPGINCVLDLSDFVLYITSRELTAPSRTKTMVMDMTFLHWNQTTLVIAILLSALMVSSRTSKAQQETRDIQHVKVFYEEGRFGGWPANVGMWSWNDEILVGFIEAEYQETEGLHTYDQSTARTKFARSLDGGHTWAKEDAYERGHGAQAYDHELDDDQAESPEEFTGSIDFTHPDFALTFRFEESFHHGPSHFYYSYDRGEEWEGPFRFPNLDTPGIATRTDYIVDGEQELSAFLTVAKSNEREGRVAHAKTTDGGENWEIVSWIGPEPEGFNIMPSSVRLSSTEILTVIRTRTEDGQDLLTSYLSEDNGETWERLRDPVADTGRGGSPPALVKLEDGRLALAYAYRSEHGSRMNVRFSSDEGRSWSDEIMLRGGDGASRDVGYPRMVQRPDGKLVVVYYWNHALLEEESPYRYIAATIFDPDEWE